MPSDAISALKFCRRISLSADTKSSQEIKLSLTDRAVMSSLSLRFADSETAVHRFSNASVPISGTLSPRLYLLKVASDIPDSSQSSFDVQDSVSIYSFNLSQNFIPNIEIDWTKAANAIKDYLVNYSDRIFGSAYSFTTSVFSGIYNTVFSVMISVYILACKEKIGRFTVKCIDVFAPKKAAAAVYHVSSLTYGCFAKFIGGQLTESVILGVLCFIGMTVFRFPNATVISVFICATSLIPIVGATLGVIVGFLLIFISSPVKALLFIVFFVVLQQLEGSLIYPRVVGKSVGLPGVIVVCAVLVGGNIGGIFGALVSVPTSAVLYILLKEAVERRTPKENTENE